MDDLFRPVALRQSCTRAVALLVVVFTLALTGCRVDFDRVASPVDGAIPPNAAAADTVESAATAESKDTGSAESDSSDSAGQATMSESVDGLPILGPVPGRSHWHASYVVRVCDKVLDPFESADDPLGIHSHADGLMHVHPFTPAAGFENATLGVFAEAMGFGISEGELVLPSGVTWRDGDNCDAARGRVFVDKWPGPGIEGEPERIFEDLASIRFEADREVYQIGFAAEDSPPVVPPSVAQLESVSAPVVVDELWVDVHPSPDLATVKLWIVDRVTVQPCNEATVPERTLTGTPGCFLSVDEQFDRSSAVSQARAVSFNRRAAVELTITDEFRLYLARRLRTVETAVVAIEVSGEVVYAVGYDADTLADNLLIVRGGLDADTARAMARLFAI